MRRGNGGRERIEGLACEKYIHRTIVFMKMCRMWKSDDSRLWCNSIGIGIVAFLLALILILGIFELIELLNGPGLSIFASCFGSFWLHFIGFSKWLYFAWRVDIVVNLVERLDSCYRFSLQLQDTPKGLKKLDEEMQRARRESSLFLAVWCIFVTWGVSHWCINPIILDNFTEVGILKLVVDNGTEIYRRSRTLPFIAWIPWDTTTSPAYEWTYAFEFLANFSSGIGNLTYDIFYLTLMMVTCAQLRYLNYSISHINERATSTSDKPTNQQFREQLKICQSHHDALLRFLTSLDVVTSPVMFAQCIGTIGIICLVTFETMTTKISGDLANLIKFWSMLEFIIAGLSQLFVFCFYASELTSLGLRVADSTWECGWESTMYDAKYNAYRQGRGIFRTLALNISAIMRRAQKPIRLTGGSFYVLSLATFRAVIGLAFSFSTVLRGMSEKQRND